MSLANQYEMFHGKSPRKQKSVEFHVPKGLVLIGKAIAIEYECNKRNGGGDGKTAVYRHEFETPAIVCMDERGGKQLYILGARVKVTDAGIEN